MAWDARIAFHALLPNRRVRRLQAAFFQTFYSKFKVIQTMVSELAQGLSFAGKPKFLAGAAISAVALLLGPGTAQAIGFEGHYAFDNWTQDIPPGSNAYFVNNTAGSPPSVSLVTPNDTTGTTTFTILAETTGTWTFHYDLAIQPGTTGGEFTAGYVYYYGDVSNIAYNFLVDQSSLHSGGGSPPISILRNASGELPTIGFYITQSSPTDFPLPLGAFTISILNVPSTATNPAPEPSSLALFAIGAMGLRMARRARGSV